MVPGVRAEGMARGNGLNRMFASAWGRVTQQYPPQASRELIPGPQGKYPLEPLGLDELLGMLPPMPSAHNRRQACLLKVRR